MRFFINDYRAGSRVRRSCACLPCVVNTMRRPKNAHTYTHNYRARSRVNESAAAAAVAVVCSYHARTNAHTKWAQERQKPCRCAFVAQTLGGTTQSVVAAVVKSCVRTRRHQTRHRERGPMPMRWVCITSGMCRRSTGAARVPLLPGGRRSRGAATVDDVCKHFTRQTPYYRNVCLCVCVYIRHDYQNITLHWGHIKLHSNASFRPSPSTSTSLPLPAHRSEQPLCEQTRTYTIHTTHTHMHTSR